MQLTKIMLAVATMAVGTAAIAAPAGARIAYSAGASATQINLGLTINGLCTAAGGTPTVFGSGNVTTTVCANTGGLTGSTYSSKPDTEFINFQGTGYAEFRLSVDAGSFGAIQVLNNAPILFRDPASGVNTAALPGGAANVGGILDLEATAFPLATIGVNTLFTTTPVGIAQTFGVAASGALYTAMFNDQKVSGAIPAFCNLGDTGIPACVPSIGKPQMATIMADNPFNTAYGNGAGFLAPSLTGQELRYVRRVDTSGTQASAQVYFLGLPCSQNPLSIVAEPTSDDEAGGLKDALITSIRVLAAPGTGNVRAELNKTDADPLVAGVQPNYAIGVMSGENNQTGQTWKWLRLNGAAMAENATPASAGQTNVATQKNGTYDFYFESVYAGGSAAGDAFWATVSSGLNSLAAPAGLVNAADLTAGYNKGGLACQASASN